MFPHKLTKPQDYEGEKCWIFWRYWDLLSGHWLKITELLIEEVARITKLKGVLLFKEHLNKLTINFSRASCLAIYLQGEDNRGKVTQVELSLCYSPASWYPDPSAILKLQVSTVGIYIFIISIKYVWWKASQWQVDNIVLLWCHLCN